MEEPRKNPLDKGRGELGGARVEGRHRPCNRVTPRTLAGRSPTRRGSRRSDDAPTALRPRPPRARGRGRAGTRVGRHRLSKPAWQETPRRDEHRPRRTKGLPLTPGGHRCPPHPSRGDPGPSADAHWRPWHDPQPLPRGPPQPRPPSPQESSPGTCKKGLGTTDARDRDPRDRPAPGLCATRADPRDTDGPELAWWAAHEHEHADTRPLASRVAAKDKEKGQTCCVRCACATGSSLRTTLPRRLRGTRRAAP
ncbi:RNA-binding motif protein, X-linked-like-2 [Mesoplodon densirostris]|uniref:RNA-binding motif protein, X-linked-like-2 n=1 Tax=Mesoplodon densirostris TaxID=48708 RepID=UPI0028DD1967|nr:RNA-binding motif protein, X-linked-like-2 [Mesoplodon densirostris]